MSATGERRAKPVALTASSPQPASPASPESLCASLLKLSEAPKAYRQPLLKPRRTTTEAKPCARVKRTKPKKRLSQVRGLRECKRLKARLGAEARRSHLILIPTWRPGFQTLEVNFRALPSSGATCLCPGPGAEFEDGNATRRMDKTEARDPPAVSGKVQSRRGGSY